VIGTSAGGVAALTKLFCELSNPIPAAVFVVMHIAPWYRSGLPKILALNGTLNASHPENNQLIQHGRIYIAPPDHHLLIEPDEHIALWHGPKENNFRPAINPLFRSAADTYKERVVGVLLTGALDDGVAGLAWIKRHRGITVVQDPSDAQFPSMPRSALLHVSVDYVLPLSKIPNLLSQLATGVAP
jgi:two-component system chemotaxis response regulator CheB